MKPTLYFAVINKFYALSYLNVGYSTLKRLNDYPLFEDKFSKRCILYTEDDIKIIQKLHPNAVFVERKAIFKYLISYLDCINEMRVELKKKHRALLN